MPEEKKKESFTFSDKIKSTKASGANKSFANRFTSKIGSDGKPRQTLFERTKRDAPFFIAALVALLLLPFLYKYSGQVEEDTPMVSPGYEDAIVNPDRSGFDFSGDADGQISQLSGRDSMDLIVGWGKHRNEEEADTSLADFYRSGLDSSAKSDASSYKRSDMDEETNITNIYKRQRKQAPAQTRAAFRRATTKIGNLKPGGMTGRGGGRLGIGHFGGGIKAAAQKVRGPGQVNSTKPVSLQPLQAAGKPSRSYFGQGAAQEARRSKDAMSKGNAMQALMDAQMKPVEPGRIGGLASGDFGGPGGGPGGLQRNFNYNGKEPWWWDMMKQRAQMEWQLWFDLKKDWITNLSDIAMRLFNCALTGSDEGDVDKFLGSGGGSVQKGATCCGWTANKCATEKDIADAGGFEKWCKIKTNKAALKAAGADCSKGFKEGSGGGSDSRRLTGWQTRWACMGGAVSAYTSGDLELKETSSCKSMKNSYEVIPSGEARKWHTYIYVVARNYVPKESRALAKVVGVNGKATRTPYAYLCTPDSTKVKIGTRSSANVSAVMQPERFDNTNRQQENTNLYNKTVGTSRNNKNPSMTEDMYEIDPESVEDACVIYVQKGNQFNYKNFQAKMIEKFEELLREQGAEDGPVLPTYFDPQKGFVTMDLPGTGTVAAQARRAFEELDLMFVESFSAEDRLALRGWWGIASSGDTVELPMMYRDFRYAYIYHKKTSSGKNSVYHLNADNRKWRVEGADYTMGDRCFFNNAASIACDEITDGSATAPEAEVTFKRGYKGKNAPKADEGNIIVTAQFTPLVAGTEGIEQKFEHAAVTTGNTVRYRFTNILQVKRDDKDKIIPSETPNALQGVVNWKLYRGGQMIDHMDCDINVAADGVPSPGLDEKECKTEHDSAACCAQKHPEGGYIYQGGKCVQECPKGADTSATCCQKLKPTGTWNTQTNKCDDPVGNGPGGNGSVVSTQGQARLAPYIAWVPATVTERKPVDIGATPKKDDFGPSVEVKTGTDNQHCVYPVGELVMNSTTAQNFVKEIVGKYNAAHKDQPISYAKEFPTVGEFVDVLHIAQTVEVKDVSKSAVCELGRKMTQVSRDPDIKTWYNELGAFFAYIDKESVFYPAQYYKEKGNCDKRFMGIREGACAKQVLEKFHHNNYTYLGKVGMNAYQKSATSLGLPNSNYPLAALAEGISFDGYNKCYNRSASGKWSCGNQVLEYRKKYNFLIDKKEDQGEANGNACNNLNGNMKVYDALRYVKQACEIGLNVKPSSVSGPEDGEGSPVTGSGNSINPGL